MSLIREATIVDVTEIVNLCKEYFDESDKSDIYGWDEDALYGTLTEHILSPDIFVCIAVDDGQVIGLSWGLITKEFWAVRFTAQLHCLYVKEGKRDYKTAKALYKSFMFWVANSGVDVAVLSTGVHSGVRENLPALAFFKRQGLAYSGTTLEREL